MRFIRLSFPVLIGMILIVSPSSALDREQRQELERILTLDLTKLTREAADLLETRYPGEDWDRWSFPSYVFTSKSSEIGYKIAAMAPDLLFDPDMALKGSDLSIPCYCFCDSMGHKNLLHCFWKEGRADGEFDEHGASCTILLWPSHARLSLGCDRSGPGGDPRRDEREIRMAAGETSAMKRFPAGTDRK